MRWRSRTTAGRAGSSSRTRRISTAPAHTGSPAETRSSSGRPAATRASIKDVRGSNSTAAASTLSIAQAVSLAGLPENRAESRTSSESADQGAQLVTGAGGGDEVRMRPYFSRLRIAPAVILGQVGEGL